MVISGYFDILMHKSGSLRCYLAAMYLNEVVFYLVFVNSAVGLMVLFNFFYKKKI